MKRNKLKHWLEYFDMLQRYVQNGYLEVYPEKNEAYITQAAIHALTPGEDPYKQISSGAILKTLRNIQIYTAYKSQEGDAYLKKDFALHVVENEDPHDLIYTLLLTHVRRWWWPWYKTEHVETFTYS